MKVGNSCPVTQHVNNPWWAVDLGVAMAVVGVLFSNRAEGHGRLAYQHLFITARDESD